MAYMLSAQLAALELERCLQGVNGGDFDVNCSGLTINELMSIANTSLQNFGSTPNGNTQRPVQDMYKN